MIAIEAATADSAWRELATKLSTSGRLQTGRGGPTIELLHVCIKINDPRQRVVFARPISPAFAIADTVSILAGFDDVSFLKFWNNRMPRFSDDGIRFCGAYGYRLGSQPRIEPEISRRLRHWARFETVPDQLKMAYDALSQTSDTRQVVLQIWDKHLDLPNPNPKSRDIPCNVSSHLLIRDGKLEWLQVMRSNDFFWGLPYNLIQFTTMQEVLAGWLGVDVGPYVHISDSLHVYKRHWRQLRKQSLSDSTPAPLINESDLRIGPYDAWEAVFGKVIADCVNLTEQTEVEDLLRINSSSIGLPRGYSEWISLLSAEALRRRNHPELARLAIQKAGSYWATSWELWASEASRLNTVTQVPAVPAAA